MRRPTSLPVLVQVGALAAAAVIASQAVAFAVVVLSPHPRPNGFTVAAAADALRGRPAETEDGLALKRRLSDQPPSHRSERDPVEALLRAALADRLAVPADRVRVAIQHEGNQGVHRMLWSQIRSPAVVRQAPSPEDVGRALESHLSSRLAEGRDSKRAGEGVITILRSTAPKAGAGPQTLVFSLNQKVGIQSDRFRFPPFAASLRLDDGRWATVEPPRSLLSPWQQRILLALALSALILAPLVWWMARQLTRPIRAFADAAERLGANPEADPLTPSGPAEVRTAIQAFNDMQASIRAHMRQRTQTIAAIAHDLRTPLTRLRFRAEQTPDAVRDRMAGDIEEMDALIGQAMAFVRGEETADRKERFDLGRLADACAHGFAETGAAVTLIRMERMEVEADPAALRRAVSNLIDNALKFAGSARVGAFRDGDQAVVEVADDGPGVGEEELDAVFEPFHRGERSRNRETGGAGLGLAVARQAARAAGGDVRLVNRPEGGLTALLALPLAD